MTSAQILSGERRKRVAILQSNYIPWKGYFDLMRSVDEFILYDDVQYTKNDWRNRNRIKTPAGTKWLSIPVLSSGYFAQSIRETKIKDGHWARTHLQTLVQHYSRAPFMSIYRARIERVYDVAGSLEYLSDVNYLFLTTLCELLGICPTISWSSDYRLEGERTERLVSLCEQAGASEYVSGPAARSYLNESLFRSAGIELRYADYSGYPEYPQLHPPFEHGVSIIDLLLSTGPKSIEFMKSL